MKISSITNLIRTLLTMDFLPSPWRMITFTLLGVIAGLGLLLVRVSEGFSYLSDNPRTCINCHIMVPMYATWQRSAHRQVAVCNDCHVPHDSLMHKYAFKAEDGMRHAALFTLRREPQVIRAIPSSQHVIQENCLRCHDRQVSGVFLLRAGERRCTDCHRTVPHGDVHGLSVTPNIPFPHLPSLRSLSPGESQ